MFLALQQTQALLFHDDMELQTPPSLKEQQLHELTHLPYQPWCASCVCFRARSDRHERSGAATMSSTPCISFYFGYAKSVPSESDAKEISTITSLVMTDSASGYVHITPLRSKNQWNLMVQELLMFAGVLGHAEPTLLQLQRHVVNARRSMGLTTHASAPPPYSHANGLVENVIGRIPPLAGSLMHYMSEQVGVDFSSNSPWWSWALRHAAWLINRFSPTKGMSPFEIVHGKDFTGKLCRFGEPVFGYCKVEGKTTAKWKRMLFVGRPSLMTPTSCTMVLVWC